MRYVEMHPSSKINDYQIDIFIVYVVNPIFTPQVEKADSKIVRNPTRSCNLDEILQESNKKSSFPKS